MLPKRIHHKMMEDVNSGLITSVWEDNMLFCRMHRLLKIVTILFEGRLSSTCCLARRCQFVIAHIGPSTYIFLLGIVTSDMIIYANEKRR